MKKEEKELLASKGFTEERLFYRTWSKESDYFELFANEKKGKISIEIFDGEENSEYEFRVDAQVEDSNTENACDVICIPIARFSSKSISDGLEKMKIYLSTFFIKFCSESERIL